MINHARTLLLNKDGDKRPEPAYFLEEYVDPGYRTLNLPNYLMNIHGALMGVNSDNAFSNYRLYQYMRLLHSTSLASYVYNLDKRVTYLRAHSAIFQFQNPYGVLLEGAASEIYFLGEVGTANSSIMSYSWTAELVSSYVARVVDLKTFKSQDTLFTVYEGLSSPIAFPGQPGFSMKISNPIAGSKWLISAFLPPSEGLPEITKRLEGMEGGALSTLFLGGSPYSGFKGIWENYPGIQEALSALILAWVYRVEEVRLSG